MKQFRIRQAKTFVVAVILVGMTALPALAGEHAEVWMGDVVIASDAHGHVHVGVDVLRDDSTLDGIDDVRFWLQRASGGEPIEARIDLATVVLADGKLTITSEIDRRVFHLALEELRAKIEARAGARDVVVTGYGLSRYAGGFEGSLSETAATELRRGDEPSASAATPVPVDCTSGGPGASSCSISGCAGRPSDCSVTCGEGYHACCYCKPSPYPKAQCVCVANGGAPVP